MPRMSAPETVHTVPGHRVVRVFCCAPFSTALSSGIALAYGQAKGRNPEHSASSGWAAIAASARRTGSGPAGTVRPVWVGKRPPRSHSCGRGPPPHDAEHGHGDDRAGGRLPQLGFDRARRQARDGRRWRRRGRAGVGDDMGIPHRRRSRYRPPALRRPHRSRPAPGPHGAGHSVVLFVGWLRAAFATTLRGPRAILIGQTMALSVVVLALSSALAYLFGAQPPARLGAFSTMAVHTSLGLLAAGMAMLLLRPTSRLDGGSAGRRAGCNRTAQAPARCAASARDHRLLQTGGTSHRLVRHGVRDGPVRHGADRRAHGLASGWFHAGCRGRTCKRTRGRATSTDA